MSTGSSADQKIDTDQHENFAVGGQMCRRRIGNCQNNKTSWGVWVHACIKMINEREKDYVCLGIVVWMGRRGEGACGNVRCDSYTDPSSWSGRSRAAACAWQIHRQKNEKWQRKLYIWVLAGASVLTKQMETGPRFVSVCVWHLIRRWQMVLVTASAVAKRLPRGHCSQGLFWWAGAPKGDRVTTQSSSSHGAAKSPLSSPRFLSLSRLSLSYTRNNTHPSCFIRKHTFVLLWDMYLVAYSRSPSRKTHTDRVVYWLPVHRKGADRWRGSSVKETWSGELAWPRGREGHPLHTDRPSRR